MMKSTATLAILGVAAGVASANQIPAPEGGLAAVSAACPAATTLTECTDYAACAAKCAPAETCPGADYYRSADIGTQYLPGGTLAAGGEYEFCLQYISCAVLAAGPSPCSSPPPALDVEAIGALGTACGQADLTECMTTCGAAASCVDHTVAYLTQQVLTNGPWATCAGYQPCPALQKAGESTSAAPAQLQPAPSDIATTCSVANVATCDGYAQCGVACVPAEACESIAASIAEPNCFGYAQCGVFLGVSNPCPGGGDPESVPAAPTLLATTCSAANVAGASWTSSAFLACLNACLPSQGCQYATQPYSGWAAECASFTACEPAWEAAASLASGTTTRAPAAGTSGAAGLASYFGTLALAALGSVALQ